MDSYGSRFFMFFTFHSWQQLMFSLDNHCSIHRFLTRLSSIFIRPKRTRLKQALNAMALRVQLTITICEETKQENNQKKTKVQTNPCLALFHFPNNKRARRWRFFGSSNSLITTLGRKCACFKFDIMTSLQNRMHIFHVSASKMLL